MQPNDLKKILGEALKPIIRTQREHGKTLKVLVEKVGTLESSVVTMEDTLKVYGDMYKINNDNDRKLEKRVITLEDNAGIEPPPQLFLARVK